MTNEEAIVELRDLISDDRTDKENEALLIAIESLRNERPKGKWKLYKSPVNRIYQCSCCGKNSPDFTAYMKMNFCPNCGADMREADNEQRFDKP